MEAVLIIGIIVGGMVAVKDIERDSICNEQNIQQAVWEVERDSVVDGAAAKELCHRRVVEAEKACGE